MPTPALKSPLQPEMHLTRDLTIRHAIDWKRFPESIGDGSIAGATLEDVERQHITKVLEQTRWRVRGAGGAADILGLKPTTLDFRMKKLGIERP